MIWWRCYVLPKYVVAMAKEVKGHMAEGHMYICFWFQKLLLVVGMILFKLGWKIVFCIATEVQRSEFKLKVMTWVKSQMAWKSVWSYNSKRKHNWRDNSHTWGCLVLLQYVVALATKVRGHMIEGKMYILKCKIVSLIPCWLDQFSSNRYPGGGGHWVPGRLTKRSEHTRKFFTLQTLQMAGNGTSQVF